MVPAPSPHSDRQIESGGRGKSKRGRKKGKKIGNERKVEQSAAQAGHMELQRAIRRAIGMMPDDPSIPKWDSTCTPGAAMPVASDMPAPKSAHKTIFEKWQLNEEDLASSIRQDNI